MSQGTHRAALIAYLQEKVQAGDWHGVSDAANDLRVLEAQIALTPMTATEVLENMRRERYADIGHAARNPNEGKCDMLKYLYCQYETGHTGRHSWET